MEAAFLAKRALFNIPKFLPHQGPPGIQSARKVTRACLSSAYERAQGSNAVAEAEGSSEISDDAPRDSMHDDGEIEEDIAVNEIRKVDQLVDTQEYRSIEELMKQEA